MAIYWRAILSFDVFIESRLLYHYSIPVILILLFFFILGFAIPLKSGYVRGEVYPIYYHGFPSIITTTPQSSGCGNHGSLP
jgi:hypothetical protein